MPKTPKNLVFIFTDQQRFDTLAAYGNHKIRTPNLNRLAEQSAVFEHAYVAQPVCTPSRATIMTGLYPHTHTLTGNNIALPEDTPTIAELVNAHDFQRGYIGKWHLGNEIFAQHGFDHWISIEDNYVKHYSPDKDRSQNCSYHHFLKKHGFSPDKDGLDFSYFSREFATRVPAEYSKPAFIAEEAEKYIAENKDNPFILYVNFLEPHTPYHSAYDEMYDPDEIDLPPNFDKQPSDDAQLKYQAIQQKAREGAYWPLEDEKSWRKQIAYYWGLVSLVDTYVGKILDALKEQGLEDDTAIVFTSDHGDMMGDYGLIAKGVMFQPSVRVPLLIRVPGVTDTNPTIEKPVSHIDLVATLLDILGQPWQGRTQGKSLYPVIKGEEELDENDVFIEYLNASIKADGQFKGVTLTGELHQKAMATYPKPTAERTLITEDLWRLTLIESGEHELYDLNTDPYERQNLYHDPNYEEQVVRLTRKFQNWQTECRDGIKFDLSV